MFKGTKRCTRRSVQVAPVNSSAPLSMNRSHQSPLITDYHLSLLSLISLLSTAVNEQVTPNHFKSPPIPFHITTVITYHYYHLSITIREGPPPPPTPQKKGLIYHINMACIFTKMFRTFDPHPPTV